ncbi:MULTISPECIES: segregation/condensation protein A [unclassified Streptomyces]|uniref:segregation and condensation protein A n=1 Tax=unclassified Streptomyces TaxID=2593676 RepID=UPI003369E9EC
MPTNPAPAQPPRPPRRNLGRGPGAGPRAAGAVPGTQAPDSDAPPAEAADARQPIPTDADNAAAPDDPAHPKPTGPAAPVRRALGGRAGSRADGGRGAAAGTRSAAAGGDRASSDPAAAAVDGREDVSAGPEAGRPAPPTADGGREALGGRRTAAGEESGDGGGQGKFTVRLANFEGPFDLLLQLISKHKLDVTEVALSKVTDEFMAHIRAMGPDWDLDQTTEFLVVAATLLDLKAARLLPAAEVEDEADLALLEARDLLFARLLQYRAFKQIADILNDRLIAESRRYPRTVGLEPHHADLLPEVVISIGAEGFAKLAVKAMQPKPKPQVYVDHIHAPLVSVREQAEVVVARLRELGEASFRTLTEDAPDVLTVVARFLALLELYRERAVHLDQEEALGSLMVRWTGAEGRQPLVTDEFDQEDRQGQKREERQKQQERRDQEPRSQPEKQPEKEAET